MGTPLTQREQQNVEVVERAIQEVWNQKKAESVIKYYDPGYTAHYEDDVFSGLDTWVDQFYNKIAESIPDLQIVIVEIVASNDTVVMRWRGTGTQQFDLFGIKPSGQKLELSGIAWIKLRNLKMIETWNSWSLQHLVQQLLTQVQELRGLVPICCYCKKIRNDEGYWKQVESYLEKHLDIALTHGICPECFAKLKLPE